MTPELREGLYQLDPYELGYEDDDTKDNSPRTTAQGPEPDDNLLNQLLSMSLNEAGIIKSLLATKNSSFDAALEYYFQHEQDDGFLICVGIYSSLIAYFLPLVPNILTHLSGERKQKEKENQEYSIRTTKIIHQNAEIQRESHQYRRSDIEGLQVAGLQRPRPA
jgi:hypothetical protein